MASDTVQKDDGSKVTRKKPLPANYNDDVTDGHHAKIKELVDQDDLEKAIPVSDRAW